MKTATIIAFTGLLGFIWLSYAPQLGVKKSKIEMEKLKTSPNFKNGKFVNQEETPVMNPEASTLKIMREFMRKGENREPDSIIITQKFDLDKFMADSNGISFVWFGHSSVLLHIDGMIVLLDPLFSERASPVSFAGTKKFEYSNNFSVDDLPHIDMVLISHDHYDHLDQKTIVQLTEKASLFVVPLGVSSHLLKWKVPANIIAELDWWQSYAPDSITNIICTPSRHFSGRTLKRNTTLWCSYVIKVNGHTIYFSGDSGYGRHFNEIGEKYGPFDLAFLECGQYNNGWPYIHMDPKETYLAFNDLHAVKMVPIHWGKFKLSLHAWTEPVEKVLASSKGDASLIITPQIGSVININENNKPNYWWR